MTTMMKLTKESMKEPPTITTLAPKVGTTKNWGSTNKTAINKK